MTRYILEYCMAEEAAEIARAGLEDWLSPGERARYKGFATDKRRGDWLAGRVAAKRALRKLGDGNSELPGYRGTEIFNDRNGRPFCGTPALTGVCISISHTSAGGLCAAVRTPALIGADWETISAIPDPVLDRVLHESEAGVLNADARARTRLWTLKEAALKLLGKGLSLDPRQIRPRRHESGTWLLELEGQAHETWRRLGSPGLRLESFESGPGLVALAYS